MRLIDADKIAPKLEGKYNQDMVRYAPTIDPESLRPKGYKEPIGYDEVYTMFFKCRVCGCEDLTAASNYCPNCGADMRGNKNA